MVQMVTVAIPSINWTNEILPTLFAVVNQSVPATRIILGYAGYNSLDSDPIPNNLVQRFCRLARIDVLRVPPGTNLHNVRKAINEAEDEDELLWFVDDDICPTYNCLEILLQTMKDYDADAVVGSKIETVRQNPFGGRDWNLAGNCVRLQRVPWCDGANLLIKSKKFDEGAKIADKCFKNTPQNMTGEDILTTAKMCSLGVAIGNPKAVAYHFPRNPERWENLDESDKIVMKELDIVLEDCRHSDWMKRTWEQSNW